MAGSRYVVVGAGLAGAATAWQLAAGGHEVTIVEQSVPANDAGSSHGSARIFRYAYPDPFYTGLVVRSRAGWDELVALGGRRLITPTGSLDFGARRDPEGIAAVLAGAGVEHELLPAAEAGRRWPQIRFDTSVLWHPGAGVIDARTAVETMLDLAVAHGAQLLTGWPVAAVRPHHGGYRLESAHGAVLDAGHLVVSAGGWLPQLLGQLPLPEAFLAQFPALQVRQENAYHFPYRDQPGQEEWPTFIHKAESIQAYGLPGGRDAGFRGQKLAEYNAGRVLPSAAAQDGLIDPANRERVIDYVRRHLPGLEPEPYAETTCLFTNTPTEDFIIDRAGNITVLSPCSGHGAKFAPLLGQLAAGLATGEPTVPEAFRPSLAAEGARL
ncbi:FAD-dependent oxidoreductase [Arthrobacter deserti]|uniref:FAD-dependent oxidoreductase n=1 Tax=Arthrobacter deserti TaxID=1742687 RepID=A0ABX1JKN7_9MICC|nr:FAD-dependent oxidoreductase [Arthrobacter deserti]